MLTLLHCSSRWIPGVRDPSVGPCSFELRLARAELAWRPDDIKLAAYTFYYGASAFFPSSSVGHAS